ncbi:MULTISPECIES: lipopolysaccharide transport periplasmic protein LptA [unclassified Acinetobacter]|uniref:lipopolysaccharide transport periplasmic protein LptA n=1 Tax=unclassified Acinetobacter TaxID=196816 RepID=UPI0035B8A75B
MYQVRHNKSRKIAYLCLLALSIFGSQHSFALDSDRKQPVTLEADRATFNERTGVTTYTGNVIIQQGSFRLNASSITANLNGQRQIQSVIAQGNPARFQQQLERNGLARGEGQRIQYNAETGIVMLSGRAFLEQNGATFRGETLTYSMSKGDIEASGGQKGRIKIVIPPSATQNLRGVRN